MINGSGITSDQIMNYMWVDENANPGIRYYYKIEEVSRDGAELQEGVRNHWSIGCRRKCSEENVEAVIWNLTTESESEDDELRPEYDLDKLILRKIGSESSSASILSNHVW